MRTSTPPATGTNIAYYHTDHLGTPQVLTDENQQIVWKADYEPFGEVNITTEAVTNNLRFPGQYFDQETGLSYNYARYYDPRLSRYITSDPIGIRGGINTYFYAYANPVSNLDPFGLAPRFKQNRSAKDLMHGAADLFDSTVCQWWPAACLFQCVRWECTKVDECGRKETFYIGQGYPYASRPGYDPNEDPDCVCVKECAKGNFHCPGGER